MSDKSSTIAEGVLIGREHWDIPVRVGLRPYLDFIRHMDEQVRFLVIQWSHTASPSAKNPWNQTRRMDLESRSLRRRQP